MELFLSKSKSAPLPLKGQRHGLRVRELLPIGGVIVSILIWEAVSRFGLLPASEFPPASVVAQALLQEAAGTGYWLSIFHTLTTWAMGLAAGVLIAVVAGIVLGRSAAAYRSMRLVIEALRPIPGVALIPLAVLWFGIGQTTKLFLIVVSVFWPMLMQTIYGVRDVDAVAIDTARSFRLSLGLRVRYLLIPSAMPYFMTGLRISASIALIVGIAAELVIGTPGVGAAINEAQASGARPEEYALIVTAGALGWGINAIFRRLEAAALHWHPSKRGQG